MDEAWHPSGGELPVAGGGAVTFPEAVGTDDVGIPDAVGWSDDVGLDDIVGCIERVGVPVGIDVAVGLSDVEGWFEFVGFDERVGRVDGAGLCVGPLDFVGF
jgi:hypothetical protein